MLPGGRGGSAESGPAGRITPGGQGTVYVCPRCGMLSHSARDAREGYCGACHDWTGGVAVRFDGSVDLWWVPVSPELLARVARGHVVSVVMHELDDAGQPVRPAGVVMFRLARPGGPAV